MDSDRLGRLYADGEEIVRAGDVGKCMFVVQSGRVEVLHDAEDGDEERLAILEAGASFGEMAIFEHEPRSATVRALGPAMVMTIDKRTFLGRVQEDPTLAFHAMRQLCERIRSLSNEIVELRTRLHEAGLEERPL